MQGRRDRGRNGCERKVRLAVALVAIAACGKSGPDRNQQCKIAARDAIAALIKDAHSQTAVLPEERASVEARNKALDAIAPRFEAILANHCIDDKWSSQVIDCYRTAPTFDALRACGDQLPTDAQRKLQTELLALLGGEEAAAPPGFAPEPARPPMTQAEHDAAVAEANALATQMKELGAKINDASQRLSAATTDFDRTQAKSELETLTKQADELRAKLAAAQAKAR
jgi:hypothetical protein